MGRPDSTSGARFSPRLAWSPADTTNILSRFLGNAKATPDAVWLTIIGADSEEPWTYKSVETLFRQYAAYYDSVNIGHGDIVFIFSGTDARAIGAFLGAILIGAVPTMMPPISPRQDPGHYWQSHGSLIDQVQPALILAGGDTYAEGTKRLPQQIINLDKIQLNDLYCNDPVDPNHETIAFLQHSSGTTSLKKGILISHAAANLQMDSYGDRLSISIDDVIVSWLPLYHDMGLVACFLLSLRHGLRLVLIDPFEWIMRPGLLFDQIGLHRGTLAWMPNFAFEHVARMIDRKHFDLSSLRLLINCSEPCRPESMRRLCDALKPSGMAMEKLGVCYAMAETVFAISQQSPGSIPKTIWVDRKSLEAAGIVAMGNDLELLSAGSPLSGVEVNIIDDSLAALPDRHVGEIVVSAPFLFSGYNGLPIETARTLATGFYRTGDRGFLNDGEVYVLGRFDDVIIVNGLKVDAGEVEHSLIGVKGLRRGRAVAFALFQAKYGSHGLVVVVEADALAADGESELARCIREVVFGRFAVTPSTVAIRSAGWILKTTSGKLNRKQNKNKFVVESNYVE